MAGRPASASLRCAGHNIDHCTGWAGGASAAMDVRGLECVYSGQS
jgi:hypothetical protein